MTKFRANLLPRVQCEFKMAENTKDENEERTSEEEMEEDAQDSDEESVDDEDKEESEDDIEKVNDPEIHKLELEVCLDVPRASCDSTRKKSFLYRGVYRQALLTDTPPVFIKAESKFQ